MAEKNSDQNLRIHLSGRKYIVGNGLCYWIVSESKAKDKDGKPKTVQKRLSGYHTDFASLFESYFVRSVKTAEIDGELADLAELAVKTRKEIRSWFGKVDKALKESEK